jgi:hypothetical protein
MFNLKGAGLAMSCPSVLVLKKSNPIKSPTVFAADLGSFIVSFPIKNGDFQ